LGGTPIALQSLGKKFVSKERMFVAGKQIKNNKIKRALQMIYFFYDGDMMIMFFFSYKLFYFVSKRTNVCCRKTNKMKRALQMIYFFSFYFFMMMI
jgi:hypothetical protein